MLLHNFLTLLIMPTTLANFLAYQRMDFPFNVLSQTFFEEKNLIPTLCAALCMSQSYRCDGFFLQLKNCSLIDFDIQVTISSTLYVRIFCTSIALAAFFLVRCRKKKLP